MRRMLRQLILFKPQFLISFQFWMDADLSKLSHDLTTVCLAHKTCNEVLWVECS